MMAVTKTRNHGGGRSGVGAFQTKFHPYVWQATPGGSNAKKKKIDADFDMDHEYII